MTQEERLSILVRRLAVERLGTHSGATYPYIEKRRLLRALMNLRPPEPIDPQWVSLQDEFLRQEAKEKGIVDGEALPRIPGSPLALWKGDITRLKADAIVNAANSALLGCFFPNHGCIDNAIHSAAGIQLRAACHSLMKAQGHEEAVGQAKLTPGFNLPAASVLHTVGPVVSGLLTQAHREQLQSCYRSCLETAGKAGLHSVAFCCISTGEFHFPNREAANIAVTTVREELPRHPGLRFVIFNVFKEEDYELYRALLG